MSTSDEELLRRTARGDGEAFARFFRRHQAVVSRYVSRRCERPHEIPDLVADVFVVALERCGRYRAETPDARPWLFGIASRVVSSRRRALLRQSRAYLRVPGSRRFELEAGTELVDDAAAASQRYAPFRDAVARLPRGEREVLCLVALADLSPTEAAQALGISPNAARVRLSRARERLTPPVSPDQAHAEVSHA